MPELTQLGRYMQDCGIKGSWLAAEVNVSDSRVSRWMHGQTSMSDKMRDKVMEALERKSEELISRLRVPLELLDDLPDPGQHSLKRSGTPFDQAVARRQKLKAR